MKSAFEIWDEVPDNDKGDTGLEKVWIHKDKVKNAIDKHLKFLDYILNKKEEGTLVNELSVNCAIIRFKELKEDLGLDNKVFGMKVKIDPSLKEDEFKLVME